MRKTSILLNNDYCNDIIIKIRREIRLKSIVQIGVCLKNIF